MNSFISHFKPWLLALVALFAIEGTYYLIVRPPRLTWNSFLDLNFAEDETVQRSIAHHKICDLGRVNADIIQVGDSSGLHGVMPKVVMAANPGYTYLNLGVATNVGYPGYLDIAELALRENPGAKYLILYTNVIGAVPRKLLWQDTKLLMSERIDSEFIRPLRNLVQLPTLSARQEVIGKVYYLDNLLKTKREMLTANRGYQAFNSIYESSLGWSRETDVEGDVPNDVFKFLRKDGNPAPADEPPAVAALRAAPRVTDEKFFDLWTLSEKSYFDHVYDAFANLAKAHGVKLILIFNPMPTGIKHPIFEHLMDWKAIEGGIERFRKRHPEVVVTGFDFWPDEKFSVFSHVATPYAVESSERVAGILRKILPPKTATVTQESEGAATEHPAPFVVNFYGPYSGYGFVNEQKTTASFPMRFMRDKEAFVFGSVVPAKHQYQMKVEFGADSAGGELPELEAEINGIPLKVREKNADYHFVTWEIPAEAVNKYLGWLIIRFSRGNSENLIPFSSIEIR